MRILAFKTKNGALLLNSISGGNSGYILHMIIGKTNNGEVAVAIGLGATVSSLTTCAYNEIGQDIGTTYQFRGSTIYWNDTSQIITAPIPTHPSTGTSCINGASTIIIGPQISPGIVNIGGIDYATDGILCLDDEDHT